MTAAPQHSPTPRELDDLELITSGILPGPLNAPGGTLRLALPAAVDAAARAAGSVEIVDPEGLPLARVGWPTGEVTPLARPAYGPFRRLYLTPAEAGDATGPILLVLAGGLPDRTRIALVRSALERAEGAGARVIVTTLSDQHPAEVRATVLAAYAAPGRTIAVVERAGTPIAEPAPDEQGIVLFFTGLSGSGKSTLARALMDRILEQTPRTLTSLDGDVVRRNLSTGLTFSKEDRETNIRRIGWVAAEIARHGGVAVCSPIAPFDQTRQQVRAMVEAAGGAFFLVHVATPLEECERRDRKGLYAKARAGEIPEFTGISSPYEEPRDADVRVDTTGRTIEDALGDVVDGLRRAGYLDLASPGIAPEPVGPASPAPLRVLFVCTGNICRSAYAELTARALHPDGFVFASAGTHAMASWPIDPEMAAQLPADVDHTAFRARQLTAELLRDADLVLTAEAAHRQFILDDHPELFRKVFTLGQAAATIERLEPGLDRAELLEQLGAQRASADLSLDVADPWHQGPDAAATCAAELRRLLGAVLPAFAPR